MNGGQAIIENGALVIRVSLDALPSVLEGAWAMNKFDTRYQITDLAEFAKELIYALNREDEQGTTPIHELFDHAILFAIEQGAFGIDEAPEQLVTKHRPDPELDRTLSAVNDAMGETPS